LARSSAEGSARDLAPAAEHRRWRSLERALARVASALAPPVLRGDWTLTDVAFPSRQWSALRLLAEIQAGQSAARERIAAINSSQRRGGPVDEPRARLARRVARVLERAGLPVKKSRSGLFAGVLGVCLEAAGEARPQEMFELIGRAIAELEPGSPVAGGPNRAVRPNPRTNAMRVGSVQSTDAKGTNANERERPRRRAATRSPDAPAAVSRSSRR
jgi:hypothetical protein